MTRSPSPANLNNSGCTFGDLIFLNELDGDDGGHYLGDGRHFSLVPLSEPQAGGFLGVEHTPTGAAEGWDSGRYYIVVRRRWIWRS